MLNKLPGIIILLWISLPVWAQHEHHQMMDSSGMTATMSHTLSRNLPMNRNGSGTSWMPDSTPIYAYMKMTGNWNFMFHGSIFIRYNSQDIFNKGSRGGDKFDAPDWIMAMAQRKIGSKGLLNVNLMMSLDPFLVGGAGYPLLYQTGESWNGRSLIDHQHPHDLFSELAVSYAYMLNRNMDLYAYIGYPGEPAIGPPAFMHRMSAFNNPDAPLGHHWQDATHIVFGVGTVGFRYKIIKIEGSGFTGREPNESRYGFDRVRFNSYSGRISVNPNANLALQVSQAFIKSPEELSPETDIKRTTFSALHSLKLQGSKHLTSTFSWGLNNDNHRNTNSFLLESNFQRKKTGIYGRYEYIQKTAHELTLSQFADERMFNANALTLGISRIIYHKWSTNLALGAQASIFKFEQVLEPIYGKYPVSFEIYLHITPALLKNM
jgi:hypothetical protein